MGQLFKLQNCFPHFVSYVLFGQFMICEEDKKMLPVKEMALPEYEKLKILKGNQKKPLGACWWIKAEMSSI